MKYLKIQIEYPPKVYNDTDPVLVIFKVITITLIWFMILGYPVKSAILLKMNKLYPLDHLIMKLKSTYPEEKQAFLQKLKKLCPNLSLIKHPIRQEYNLHTYKIIDSYPETYIFTPEGHNAYLLTIRYLDVFNMILSFLFYNHPNEEDRILWIVTNNDNNYVGHIYTCMYKNSWNNIKTAFMGAIGKSITETYIEHEHKEVSCIATYPKFTQKLLEKVQLEYKDSCDCIYTFPLPDAVPNLKKEGFELIATNLNNIVEPIYGHILHHLLKVNNILSIFDLNKDYPFVIKWFNKTKMQKIRLQTHNNWNITNNNLANLNTKLAFDSNKIYKTIFNPTHKTIYKDTHQEVH